MVEKHLARLDSILYHDHLLIISRSASMRFITLLSRSRRHNSLHSRSIRRVLLHTIVLCRSGIRKTGLLKRLCKAPILSHRQIEDNRGKQRIKCSPLTLNERSRDLCQDTWIISL